MNEEFKKYLKYKIKYLELIGGGPECLHLISKDKRKTSF